MELELALSIRENFTDLEQKGLCVDFTDDFEQVYELFGDTGRKKQTPMMSVTRNDFTKNQAFWLFVKQTESGEVVGGMAARLIDLSGENFERYLRRTSKFQYNRDEDPILEVAPAVKRELHGKLIYFGELEFQESKRGLGKSLEALSDIAKAVSALKWPNFDQMYAFIPDEHYVLAKYYGLTSCHIPNAITWCSPPPEGRKDSHWIMTLCREDYHHYIMAKKRGLIGRKLV